MAGAGDAVYLPRRRGGNELVLAVIQLTGGWAFSARVALSEVTESLPAIALVTNGNVPRSAPTARAVKLVPLPGGEGGDQDMMALLERREPVWTREDSSGSASAREPVGNGRRFYLRPTTGRADHLKSLEGGSARSSQ
jgi:hypothetical protein